MISVNICPNLYSLSVSHTHVCCILMPHWQSHSHVTDLPACMCVWHISHQESAASSDVTTLPGNALCVCVCARAHLCVHLMSTWWPLLTRGHRKVTCRAIQPCVTNDFWVSHDTHWPRLLSSWVANRAARRLGVTAAARGVWGESNKRGWNWVYFLSVLACSASWNIIALHHR